MRLNVTIEDLKKIQMGLRALTTIDKILQPMNGVSKYMGPVYNLLHRVEDKLQGKPHKEYTFPPR